jgi:spore germination cell wall hydrolase CwlJ-like protein
MVGQIAVAEVVMNRVADSRYPNTICEVVKQGPKYKGSDVPVRHRCQFSWYCDGKSDIPKNEKAWKKAQDYAYLVLYNRITIDVTEGATHYHATYVKPSWAKTKTRTTRIESHIFYRWEK